MVRPTARPALQRYDQATCGDGGRHRRPRAAPAALYAQLSIFAHGAGQTRKATSPGTRRSALTPAAQRKQIKDTIQQNWTALDQAKSGTTSGAQGTTSAGYRYSPAARPCSSTGRAADS